MNALDLGPGHAGVWVIAHRGDSAHFPENTEAAFDAAMGLPIDAIELDLQISADGRIVVYHDRTLKRLGHPYRRITGLSLEALQRLDAGSWFDRRFRALRLTTLDAVIDRYGRRIPLLFEIKLRGGPRSLTMHRRLARRTAERLRDAGLEGHAYCLSFDLERLLEMRAVAPSLGYIWNLREPPPLRAETAWAITSLVALSCDIRTLRADFVDWAHGHGKAVLSHTVNDATALTKARNCRVDGLFTDDPAWLIDTLDGGDGAAPA